MPSGREKQYYFGRFNVIGTYENYHDKKEYLLESFRSDAHFNYRNNKYGFFHIREFSDSEEQFIYGVFAKYRDEDQYVANRETGELEPIVVENQSIAESKFFLNVRTGIIGFHLAGQHIPTEKNLENYSVKHS